ncbi:UNVERIFIED_CONTAM: Histidine--tRNA ligase, chloroplastic/mitochondrial [Sesamum angustifolium]|uniref:histidine--tRNA ligase n=1 Tax=Sesamum angustifolium TaxID=2727405 RepID=A0AAW2J8H5_9LAMI
MRLRNWLFQNFREVSQLFGFEEVDFPVLESEALFIRKAGEEIRDQCWRYERMTRDAVVSITNGTWILLAYLMLQIKIDGIVLPICMWQIVLQEVLRRYSIPESLFGRVCVIIDKLEKIPIDDIKKELMSVELTEDAVEELLQILSVKSLTKLEEKLGSSVEALADLKQLFSLAEKYGYSDWIQFDASIVRGLAYYTGIVFEGFDREGKLRAICGGGRYDRLLSTFGGDDIPACGFGFGDAVIVELLKERGLMPELSPQVQNIVCSLDQDLQGAASSVAARLREKGQSVDLVLENKPLKCTSKCPETDNSGKYGMAKGMVSVKILSSGEQYEIKFSELE